MAVYTEIGIESHTLTVEPTVAIDTDTYRAPSNPVVGIVQVAGTWIEDTRTYSAPSNPVESTVVPGGTWVKDSRSYSAPSNPVAGQVIPGGARIPTGEFRRVQITVQDQEGNPLTEAVWVQSAGLFPTAGRVLEENDGSMVANVWLLPQDYEDLAVLAENTRPGEFDYVWYDAVDGTACPADKKAVTVQFTRAEAPPPGAPPSFSAGTGISFG